MALILQLQEKRSCFRQKKNELSKFLRKWVLNFDFSKSRPYKVKKDHQNSMCDSSKEPLGFTDSESKEKLKNIEI